LRSFRYFYTESHERFYYVNDSVPKTYQKHIPIFYRDEIIASPSPSPAPMIDLEEDTNSSSTSKRSLVYQYFTFKTSRYYCNNCSKNFSDSSTSTLWRHLNKNHPKIVAESQAQEGKVGGMDKFVISDKQENVSLIFIALISYHY